MESKVLEGRGRVLRRAKAKREKPPAPRSRLLVDAKRQRVHRVIVQGDGKLPAAVVALVSMYANRVRMINDLCEKPADPRTRFLLRLSPDAERAAELLEPTRRGRKLEQEWLDDDRPNVIGGCDSFLCGASPGFQNRDLGPQSIALLTAHLRKAAEWFTECANELDAHVSEYPEAWKPLPTLAEYLRQTEGGDA